MQPSLTQLRTNGKLGKVSVRAVRSNVIQVHGSPELPN